MEIYYFGNKGEKVGPITKEGLVNLAKAGVVTEQTAFEINGKTVKGKHIKTFVQYSRNKKRPSRIPFRLLSRLETNSRYRFHQRIQMWKHQAMTFTKLPKLVLIRLKT